MENKYFIPNTSGNGWTCSGCGSFVLYGQPHVCGGSTPLTGFGQQPAIVWNAHDLEKEQLKAERDEARQWARQLYKRVKHLESRLNNWSWKDRASGWGPKE